MGRNVRTGCTEHSYRKKFRSELRKNTFLMGEFAALFINYHYYCCYILF